jgi:DNA-directed RNA polymerase specialized sigma24 family protein
MGTTWPVAVRPRGDHGELFEALADRLLAAVRAAVRTSPVNVEDACAFAWLQLVRYRPERACAFGWLRKTAIREAVRLERRSVRTVELDTVADVVAGSALGLDRQLALIVAGEQIRAARLRPREARVLGFRVAGYSRREMAELTGDSDRSVDRQLVRAQRKLNDAREARREIGSGRDAR